MEGEGRNANDESTNENKLMTEINLFYFILLFFFLLFISNYMIIK
jgi:hypothetical protein